MDIDAIALGEDFVEAIETIVAKCDVLIAVIGNNWFTSKDDRGNRRLDNREDFVRIEIATALKRGIRVIPVLVDGALMPRATDLPDDLKSLVRRNALLITDTSFDADVGRLATAIKSLSEKAQFERRTLTSKSDLPASTRIICTVLNWLSWLRTKPSNALERRLGPMLQSLASVACNAHTSPIRSSNWLTCGNWTSVTTS